MNFSQYCRWVAKEVDAARAVENKAMPQSTKERQEALRARRAMLGQTEVRGIYLPSELHAALKAYAKKLVKKPRPEPPYTHP